MGSCAHCELSGTHQINGKIIRKMIMMNEEKIVNFRNLIIDSCESFVMSLRVLYLDSWWRFYCFLL